MDQLARTEDDDPNESTLLDAALVHAASEAIADRALDLATQPLREDLAEALSRELCGSRVRTGREARGRLAAAGWDSQAPVVPPSPLPVRGGGR